jgi:hypothetical protein
LDFGFSCYRFRCTQNAFAGAGLSCGSDRDAGVLTRCTAGATCVADAGVSKCVAPAADTASCDTAAGINCDLPARCVSTNGMPTDGGPVVGACTVSTGSLCQ